MIPLFAIVRICKPHPVFTEYWLPLFLVWLMLLPIVLIMLPVLLIACLLLEVSFTRFVSVFWQILASLRGSGIQVNSVLVRLQ